jgi:hypothetical protein
MAALREFDRWSVRDVRREQNERADQLVNEELDRRASGGAARPEEDEPPEAEIEELLSRWDDAAQGGEMAFLEKLLAPEFTATTGTEVRTREQYLADVRDGRLAEPGPREALAIQHYGRFAVARSRTDAGAATEVFVKQAGRWRAVVRHQTEPLAR